MLTLWSTKYGMSKFLGEVVIQLSWQLWKSVKVDWNWPSGDQKWTKIDQMNNYNGPKNKEEYHLKRK